MPRINDDQRFGVDFGSFLGPFWRPFWLLLGTFLRHGRSVRLLMPELALEGRFLSQKGSPSDVKLAALASEARLCERGFASSCASFVVARV